VTKRLTTSFEYSPLVATLDLLALHSCSWLAMNAMARFARSQNLRIYAHTFLLLSILAVASFSVCGLYRSWSRRATAGLFSSLFMAECLYVTAWMSLGGWEPEWRISRSVIAASAVLQFLAVAAERGLIRGLVRSEENLESGVIVSSNRASADAFRNKLQSASPAWLTANDCLTDEEFQQLAGEDIPWGAVLVTADVDDKTPIIQKASQLRKSVFILPGISELRMAGAQPEKVDDVLMLRMSPPYLSPAERAIKRLLDVAGSLCLLALAGPAMMACAILVRLGSEGPALFRQTRVGADGKEYTLCKFRTMIVNAEQETGPVMAASRDPRVTGIGRFLRASRMDELPQLINVLMGDMSLVGPRPERPHFVRIFREALQGYELRLAVKPGITGLAQIDGRYSTTPERKLRFDLLYIYNYSLALDIQILARTFLTVLQPSHAEGLREGAAGTAWSGGPFRELPHDLEASSR
jgi:exopolysaccharide biosynthesis polyprenyl glycosylphosphotransferase